MVQFRITATAVATQLSCIACRWLLAIGFAAEECGSRTALVRVRVVPPPRVGVSSQPGGSVAISIGINRVRPAISSTCRDLAGTYWLHRSQTPSDSRFLSPGKALAPSPCLAVSSRRQATASFWKRRLIQTMSLRWKRQRSMLGGWAWTWTPTGTSFGLHAKA